MLNDADLLADFESATATAPPSGFHHAEHLRVAFLLLRAAPLPEALARFSGALRRFAGPKLHETITWSFMLLVHERLARAPALREWRDFIAAHPELLDKGFLRRYYTDETLGSALARATFILPDRLESRGLSDGSAALRP